MNDRLTPKPGDWVMVDGRQFDDGKNRFGTVVERGAYASGDEVTVELDVSGKHYCRPQNVTVVKSVSSALTPRVGDRVIIPPGRMFAITTIGRVIHSYPDNSNSFEVRVDGEQDTRGFRVDELQVVDREPVEWPAGWGPKAFEQRNGVGTIVNVVHSASEATVWLPSGTRVDLTRADVEHLAATVPDVVDRWDDLIGDDS